MLVLSRKVGEEIVLPNCGVTIGVVSVNGSHVRLGIVAPPETSVHRKEVWQRIHQSHESGHNCGIDGSTGPPTVLWEPQISDSPNATECVSDWQQEVRRRIAARTHGLVSEVQVEAVDGRFIVYGRSHSYYGKQLALVAAQEAIDSMDSIPSLQIELAVEVSGD